MIQLNVSDVPTYKTEMLSKLFVLYVYYSLIFS